MATAIAALPRIPLPRATHRIGILLGVAAISMMFIGLTSAYLVDQGLGPLWKQVHLSPLIGINTAILLVSSYTMERARRAASRKWLIGTLVLGLAFLAGQIGVFSQLANEGLFLNTGRQASFYYVLTGLHGLHMLGGVAALAWTAMRMKATALEVTSIYWHFMGALWLYLLLVIFL
jgi:cytochrome c oxidase subunit 3